ncbi:hypothetical protein KUTeg_010612 [Tegillarca granosa]|uniref:Uncharacterized protein n=1 Tax=Tegillarca granosa TaxID=220873 RepID=A0ABQ9F5H7_TEGGR|nr:hypothetical protein KUTeg_010612 [Tegillarca granosa]
MNQIRILAVSATFLFFNVIVAQDETEMIHIVRPRIGICPENATCADVWDTIRRRMGQPPERDLRYIQNCFCEDGSCPETEDYMIRCICEGHLRELTGRAKATRLNGRTRYDPVGLTYIQMYECTRGGRIIWRRRGRRKGRRRNRNRNRNTNQ